MISSTLARVSVPTCGSSLITRDTVERELRRLKSSGQSAEGNVIRTYLDLIASLPWSERAEGSIDVRAIGDGESRHETVLAVQIRVGRLDVRAEVGSDNRRRRERADGGVPATRGLLDLGTHRADPHPPCFVVRNLDVEPLVAADPVLEVDQVVAGCDLGQVLDRRRGCVAAATADAGGAARCREEHPVWIGSRTAAA